MPPSLLIAEPALLRNRRSRTERPARHACTPFCCNSVTSSPTLRRMRELVGRERDAELHLDLDDENDVVPRNPKRNLRCIELFGQNQVGIDDAAKNRLELRRTASLLTSSSPVPRGFYAPARTRTSRPTKCSIRKVIYHLTR